jgi:hypothetical protein
MDNDLVSAEKEISLKEIILKAGIWRRYLLTRWKFILIFSVLGGGLFLAYAFVKKPLYTAKLSFALEDSKTGGGLGAYSGLASQFGFDLGGSSGAFSGDNLLELFRSRSMIEKALLTPLTVDGKSETLAELYINFNNLRSKWKNDPELANVKFLPGSDNSKFSLKQDSLLGDFWNTLLLRNLYVDKVDKKLSIIVVKVTSKNEIFSKSFAEILTNEVSKFYIDTKIIKASRNVNILQHQTDSVRSALNLAINGVASSIDINPNANPNRMILRTPSQHKQIDVQVNTAILSELVKNLEISKVSLRNETPLVQIIDLPILPLKKDKVSRSVSMILGIFIGAFVAIMFITIQKVYNNIISEP